MRVENGVVNCICGALTIRTPGVQVRLEYPRQFYAQIENFRTNKTINLTTFVLIQESDIDDEMHRVLDLHLNY